MIYQDVKKNKSYQYQEAGKAIICSNRVRRKKDNEMEKELGKSQLGGVEREKLDEEACLPFSEQPQGACNSSSPFLEFKSLSGR